MVKPQAIHHAVGDPSGYHPMPHEMSHAAAIQGKALWLAHIVKQHGPPKQRFRPDGVQRMEGMLPHIVAVVRISLVKAHHGQDLRQRSACRFRILPQDRRRIRAAQQLGQLLADPLRRNVPQQFPAARQRRAGGRFDGKAQHGRKPQAAQDSEGILGKAPFRLAHAAQDSRFQIRPSFEGIIQRFPQICRHGIDGKIPPGQILRQGSGKRDLRRVAVVGICAVPAEGGGLHLSLRPAYRHRAVLQPRGNGFLPKDRHRLLRQGGGGHIPVPRHAAQQAVPDAAAHAVRLMSRLFQRLQSLLHIGGNRQSLSVFLHISRPFQLHFCKVHTIIR